MMKQQTMMALLAACAALVPAPAVFAQAMASEAAVVAENKIEALDVVEQAGTLFVRVRMKDALSAPPASFSVASPARIAFDFPATTNGLGRSQQNIAQGDLRSANIVQAGGRTRLVLNLAQLVSYDTKVSGNEVLISLHQSATAGQASSGAREANGNFATPRHELAALAKSIQDIHFRRGKDGEGRVVVNLSSPETGIDIRPEGGSLVVEFMNTALPEQLRRRSDVTDFGTPVTSMVAQTHGDNVRLVVTPHGMWEHNAYQSDTQFVLEVRKLVEDPHSLVQGLRPGSFGGEKLSLNFQNIDVRSVLQVIADFTNFNIVTSDSVQGNLTLRLKDVPWDQALDIILQAKGLDMRKNGNVIWIAPGDELATREKLLLESQAQIGDLEPLQTESFQINYHSAKEIYAFLSNKDQSVLSARGSVVFDDRSNKIFATDVGSRLAEIRRLINEIDIAPRQVLIEARIVEASKSFARDLGVRLGLGGVGGRVVGYDAEGRPIRQGSIGGLLEENMYRNGQLVGGDNFNPERVTSLPGGLNLNMAARPTSGAAGALSMVLWNNAATRFLNLELSALESDGRGRIVSSPKILTANQVEAAIEQGTEIPYQEATSSGATSTAFKKAVLSLRVRPQITPDGRVQLRVSVNKDRPIYGVGDVPAIDTKNVLTEVLVENGGTVVIGGIFQETESNSVARIPVLGELPFVGTLFRNTQRVSDQSELLVFITPRIVSEDLTLR